MMANLGLNPGFVESEDLKWTTSKGPSKILFCILILEFVLRYYLKLRFSPPVEGVKIQTVASNPKRRQRQIARSAEKGIGTKSQQAMKLAQEAGKLARKVRTKEQREAEEQRKRELHAEKKKAKHRGH